MRLFIAVNISEEAENELQKIQGKLKSLIHDYSIVASFPKTFHLTLKFLGGVEETDLNRIITKLDQIKSDDFYLRLSNIDCFPDKKRPRIIWSGLKPTQEIKKLQEQIDLTLQELFPTDKRFIPHLTLTRIKHIKNKNPKSTEHFIQLMLAIKPANITFKANSFILYKSELKNEGPIYSIIKTWKLSR